MNNDDEWWLIIMVNEQWWRMMMNDDVWWWMIMNDDELWMLVKNDWVEMILRYKWDERRYDVKETKRKWN